MLPAQGMTKKFTPPFYEKQGLRRELAVPEFMAHQAFGSLIPSGTDPYYMQHLAHRTMGAWVWGDLRAWKVRVLTGLELLERVPSRHFVKLARLLSIAMGTYYGPQKMSFFQRKSRHEQEKGEEPELRFTSLFTQYQYDLENLYRHASVPYAFAKEALFNGAYASKPEKWFVDQSSKKKAAILDSPISLSAGPVNSLTEGYDRHFRNAIAHSRFRFLNRETVEMWDVNEKGIETWRENLTYEKCRDKLENLEATITAMEAAYFLFVMQNHKKLVATEKFSANRVGSEEERDSLIYDSAKIRYQLEVTDIVPEGDSLSIKAKIVPNFDIPQTSEIIMGGPSGPSRFEVEIKVFEVGLPQVVFGFIRNIYPVLHNIGQLTVQIRDTSSNDAGKVVLSKQQLELLAKADESVVPVEALPSKHNSLSALKVKFSLHGKPRPKRSEPPRIVIP